MSPSSLIAVLAGLLLLVLGKVCLDLASKQVQGWLFDLCFVVLRVVKRRLPTALHVARHDEELAPELKWILFDRYANEPVVGLYKGFRFALSNVRGAKKLARESVKQLPDPWPKWGHWVILRDGRRVYIEGRRRWWFGHRVSAAVSLRAGRRRARGRYVRGHWTTRPDGRRVYVRSHWRRERTGVMRAE